MQGPKIKRLPEWHIVATSAKAIPNVERRLAIRGGDQTIELAQLRAVTTPNMLKFNDAEEPGRRSNDATFTNSYPNV